MLHVSARVPEIYKIKNNTFIKNLFVFFFTFIGIYKICNNNSYNKHISLEQKQK